jgi:hypothetical protein
MKIKFNFRSVQFKSEMFKVILILILFLLIAVFILRNGITIGIGSSFLIGFLISGIISRRETHKKFTAQKHILLDADINISGKRYWTLGLLGLFYWFCGKENREHIALTIDDLKEVSQKMAKQGRGRFFISVVLLCRGFNEIVPIVWDKLQRILEELARFAKLMRQIRLK